LVEENAIKQRDRADGLIQSDRSPLYDLAVAQALLPGGVAELGAPPAEIFSVGPNDRS
jgi:hypothetical protein